MKAMVLEELSEVEIEGQPRKNTDLPFKKEPLVLRNVPDPIPGPGQVRIKITACGVCHTELDEIEGRRQPKLPVIPGHEIIGFVDKLGGHASRHKLGARVGVGWIFNSCRSCPACAEKENLCEDFMGAGSDADGGYAEYMVVDERFAYPIPEMFTDSQAAPLMCAGAVGYRALKLTNMINGETLGLFGFGASAHIIIQAARWKFPDSPIYILTRSREHRDLALKLGAAWAGEPDEIPPEKINRAIDFTPVGETLSRALQVMEKGGRLVINAIRKKTPINLDYTRHIWYEKEVKSVANVTRRDIEEFLPLAAEIPIIPEVTEYPLEKANEALRKLKEGKIQGAAVLKVS